MRITNPVPAVQLTDWNGQLLSRKHIDKLTLGCVVRIVIENSESRSGEAVYCQITKMKDGTFWGIVQDTYRLYNWIGEILLIFTWVLTD